MMMDFPKTSTSLLIPGPAGNIEAKLEFPIEFQALTPIVLICHPHPPDGGTMNNKVVTTLAKAFIDAGYISVRFNFRGVGQSDGIYDQGNGELLDCLALITWLQLLRPNVELALAGFSFGAWVALKAAETISPKLMVTVAPPVGFRDFSDVLSPNCPWLAIQGMADEVVNPETVLLWLKRQNPTPEILAMEETSHFFHGKLVPLRAYIGTFLKRNNEQVA